MRDAFEALLEACLKSEPGELDLFFRLSIREVKDDMLGPRRILEKKPLPSPSAFSKTDRVGESVPSEVVL